MRTVTNVHSVANRKNSEREDRHTDVVLQQTEPGTLFFTLSMVNLSDITQITSSNISRWI
jgi:hypothetical protein